MFDKVFGIVFDRFNRFDFGSSPIAKFFLDFSEFTANLVPNLLGRAQGAFDLFLLL